MKKRRIMKGSEGKTRKPLSKKQIIIISAAVAVAAAVAVFAVVKKSSKKKSDGETATARVTRGSISRVLEGSGTLEAIDQYEVSALVSGDVTADFFEEGDMVSKDQVLYKIDASSIEKNIDKAQNALSQSKMSYSEAVEAYGDLTVSAPCKGVIKTLYIKNGDDIKTGDRVCDIVDSDTMTLEIKFLSSQAGGIYSGQEANIEMTGGGGSYMGTVKTVSSGSTVNSLGVPVTNVEISVTNPGAITTGDTATAVVDGTACAEPGTFKYSHEETVTAKASGKVRNLSLIEGDRVSAGRTILTIESSSVSNQVKKSALSVSDAELSLKGLQDDLDQYSISSPIAGKVIQKTVKAGDKVASQQGSTSMAVIADLSALTMTMNIDELDISSVKVGQDVEVTADALENQVFHGVVNKVSVIGTSQNGVTTYPVEVLLTDVENTDLIPGMNVSATIVLEKKDDVLLIPTTAVKRGNKVKMLGSGEEVEIETGIDDGTQVEVLSGLSEGDQVEIADVPTKSIEDTMMQGMQGGMGGERGMPGGDGAPSGGGPSGGASSGGGMPGGGR
mgnify:FL=1